MRDIKFRVWDKFQKKYIFEGFHVMGEITAFGGIECEIHETWEARKKALGHECTLDAWDDFICEQFVGLQDKTGKDIYEGDILCVANNHKYEVCFLTNEEDEIIASYGLRNIDAHVEFPIDTYAIREGKIVGHIHEDYEKA